MTFAIQRMNHSELLKNLLSKITRMIGSAVLTYQARYPIGTTGPRNHVVTHDSSLSPTCVTQHDFVSNKYYRSKAALTLRPNVSTI